MKIIIINGPNINMLGIREKNIYGMMSYDQMCDYLYDSAKVLDVVIDIFQSNSEGEIIECLQQAYCRYDGIIINPAAYTHYSIAIYDALRAIDIPIVEVHISNIYSREELRKKSVTAAACIGQICGFGVYGYVMAMSGLINVKNA